MPKTAARIYEEAERQANDVMHAAEAKLDSFSIGYSHYSLSQYNIRNCLERLNLAVFSAAFAGLINEKED